MDSQNKHPRNIPCESIIRLYNIALSLWIRKKALSIVPNRVAAGCRLRASIMIQLNIKEYHI